MELGLLIVSIIFGLAWLLCVGFTIYCFMVAPIIFAVRWRREHYKATKWNIRGDKDDI